MIPSTVLWPLVFIGSLFVLIKASQYFTRAAEQFGLFLGMPPFLVGGTVVAVGTSLPELISSTYAAVYGPSEIVVGNAVGSNVTNIFLVLGVTVIYAGRIETKYDLIRVDLPLFVGSAFLLAATIWDGDFTAPEACLCLAGFVVYVLYTLSAHSRGEDDGSQRPERKLDPKVVPILIVSAFFICLGARYTVESVVEVSQMLNLGAEVVSATAVALGTSLPELAVSIAAVRQGQQEIAIGNVLGSNIFNALAVMGIPGLLGQLAIPDTIRTFALPMMIVGTLLYVFMTQDKQITRWEGWLLLVFYVFFAGRLLGFI